MGGALVEGKGERGCGEVERERGMREVAREVERLRVRAREREEQSLCVCACVVVTYLAPSQSEIGRTAAAWPSDELRPWLCAP